MGDVTQLDTPAPAAAPVRPDTTDAWWRDAVIYQLHIKSFFDSNNDGVGDFPGLIRRLAYMAPDHKAKHWLLLMLADRVDEAPRLGLGGLVGDSTDHVDRDAAIPHLVPDDPSK